MADPLQTTDHSVACLCPASEFWRCGDNDPKDWIMLDDLNEIVAYRWVEADVPLPSGELIVEGSAENAE